MNITDFELIISKDNFRLKAARAVRNGRDKTQVFAEGARVVNELAKSGLLVTAVFVSESHSLDGADDSVEFLISRKVPIFRVSRAAFDSLKDTEHSQGIIALAKRPSPWTLSNLPNQSGPYVFLCEVNNPSNLGAVVRSAEAAGAAAVVTSPGSADAFSPKAIRASMGSAFRLPIVRELGLADFIHYARQKEIKTVAIEPAAETDYSRFDWTVPAAMIFGSEAHGLKDFELSAMDASVRIPMDDPVESLNLAVSAGILLFEAKRQSALKEA